MPRDKRSEGARGREEHREAKRLQAEAQECGKVFGSLLARERALPPIEIPPHIGHVRYFETQVQYGD